MAQPESKMPADEQEKSHRKPIHCPFCIMNIFLTSLLTTLQCLGTLLVGSYLTQEKPASNNISRKCYVGKLGGKGHIWTIAFADDFDQWHIDLLKIVPFGNQLMKTIGHRCTDSPNPAHTTTISTHLATTRYKLNIIKNILRLDRTQTQLLKLICPRNVPCHPTAHTISWVVLTKQEKVRHQWAFGSHLQIQRLYSKF